MRKTVILVAAILGWALFAAPAALAHHRQDAETGQQNCYGEPLGPSGLSLDASGTGDGGHIGVASCDNAALDGNVTFGGDFSDRCGYIAVDGDPDNGAEADGYVGVDNERGLLMGEGQYPHSQCTNS